MTNQLNIAQVIALSIEELQAMTAGQLAELHSTVKDSKQKAATRRADLIAGLIKGKQKAKLEKMGAANADEILEQLEAQKSEQLELVPVENSVKPKPSRKPKTVASKKAATSTEDAHAAAESESEATAAPVAEKPKASRKPKAGAKKTEPKAEEPKAEEKAPEPKKTLKRKKAAAPDLDKMDAAELRKLAAELVEKAEDFPAVVPGEKASFHRLDGFDTVKDIQAHLLKNPMSLYMLVDEKIDENMTYFLVLYANENVIVLHDRNREIDSTMTAKMTNMDAETIKFDKLKFKYSFYNRVPNK